MTDQQAPELTFSNKGNVEYKSVQAREAFFKRQISTMNESIVVLKNTEHELNVRIKELETEIQIMKPLYELYKKQKVK